MKRSDISGERIEILLKLQSLYSSEDTTRALSYIRELVRMGNEDGIKEARAASLSALGALRLFRGYYENASRLFRASAMIYLSLDIPQKYGHALVDLGNTKLYLASYDSALHYYEKALEVFREIDLIEGQSRCLNNMGIVYKNHGKYDKAIRCYMGNVGIYEELDDHYSLSQTYINLGNVYVFLGSYPLALEYFKRAYDEAMRSEAKKEMAISMMNSGVVQNKIGNYEKALEYYRKSLAINQENSDLLQVSNCLTNIGTNYIPMKEYDLALEYIERGLAIKKELGDLRLISNSYNFLSEVYQHKEDHERSIELNTDAVRLKKKIDDAEGLSRCYNALGESYFALGNDRLARAHADSALQYSRSIGAIEQVASAYRLMKEIASAGGNYRKAYEFAELYKIYSDSLLNYTRAREVGEVEMRFASRILEQENEKLRLKSIMDADILQKQRRGLILVIMLISLLLAILILVIYYQWRQRGLFRELKEQNQIIIRQNQNLDHLNRTKEKILSILNHDLRSKIGNQVLALSLLDQDEFSDDQQRRAIFEKLGNSATLSIEQLENLVLWSRIQDRSMEFHPESVDIGEILEEALEFYRHLLKTKSLAVREEIGNDLKCKADRRMINAIFRNLIGNAIKYSEHGQEIEIKARRSGKSLHCAITDHGKGMDDKDIVEINRGMTPELQRGSDKEKGSGIGILLVREFLEYHKGKLEVKSKPGKGSVFTVTFNCEG